MNHHPALQTDPNYNLIVQFPQEIIMRIFAHLPSIDGLVLAATCKKWYTVSQSEELWETICKNEIHAWEKMKKEGNDSWRTIYTQVFSPSLEHGLCYSCGSEGKYHPIGYSVCDTCYDADNTGLYDLVGESKLKKYGVTAQQLRTEHGLICVNRGYSTTCGFNAGYIKHEDFYLLKPLTEIFQPVQLKRGRKGTTKTSRKKRKY